MCGENRNSAKPCYWVNGILTNIAATAQYAWTYGICVSNGDVYVVGGDGSSDPCYWKNGVKNSLTRVYNNTTGSGTYQEAETRAIFVKGTDVYVAGRKRYPGSWRACYWKNNTPFDFTTDGTKDAWANGIAVHNGKVYAAGYDEVDRGACYWENECKITLEGSYGHAYDIAVAGNNVYVVGDYVNINWKNVACIWINGVRIDLTDGTNSAEALAIALSWE